MPILATNLIAFAGKHWKLILGGLVVAFLGLKLVFAQMEARHFRKLYAAEQQAHQATVANFRAASAKAQADATANAKRVLTDQQRITQEVSSDYQKQLADVRARADALRVQLYAKAHPGNPNPGRASEVSAAAGRPDGSAPQAGLPAQDWSLEDRVIATEQALQLAALQEWVRKQAGVDFQGPR